MPSKRLIAIAIIAGLVALVGVVFLFGLAGPTGTIGIFMQAASYTITPVSFGMHPSFLGTHEDLAIPTHVMNWYKISCGQSYRISGTLYYYNFTASGPSFYGVGNLKIYTHAVLEQMITGTNIVSFATIALTNYTFSSVFTAC